MLKDFLLNDYALDFVGLMICCFILLCHALFPKAFTVLCYEIIKKFFVARNKPRGGSVARGTPGHCPL